MIAVVASCITVITKAMVEAKEIVEDYAMTVLWVGGLYITQRHTKAMKATTAAGCGRSFIKNRPDDQHRTTADRQSNCQAEVAVYMMSYNSNAHM